MPKSGRRVLVLNVVLTRKCNLECKHCYISASREADLLSEDELERLIMSVKNFIRQFSQSLTDLTGEEALFIVDLTGGEPLLYGKRITGVVGMLLEGGERVKVNISTNLTVNIDSLLETVSLFPDVSVSTSFDPVIRFPVDDLEKQWLKNYHLLTEKGNKAPEVEVTVTRYLVENSHCLENLIDHCGICNLSFCYIFPEGRALRHFSELAVPFGKVSEFLRVTFNRYSCLRQKKVLLLNEIIHGNPIMFPYGSCTDKFYVFPEGKMEIGERCMRESRTDLPDGTNFSGWFKIYLSYLTEKVNSLSEKCFYCEWLSFCQGGCPFAEKFYRKFFGNGKGKDTEECSGLKSFLDYMKYDVDREYSDDRR